MVARDGIEPPTPAFSGLDSSKAICLQTNYLQSFSSARAPFFWDSNGTREWDNKSGRSDLPSHPIPGFYVFTPRSLDSAGKVIHETDNDEGAFIITTPAGQFRKCRLSSGSRSDHGRQDSNPFCAVRSPVIHVSAAIPYSRFGGMSATCRSLVGGRRKQVDPRRDPHR